MEEQDLEEIGILDHSHRKKILEAAELLPRITPIGKTPTVLLISLGKTFFFRHFILNENILF